MQIYCLFFCVILFVQPIYLLGLLSSSFPLINWGWLKSIMTGQKCIWRMFLGFKVLHCKAESRHVNTNNTSSCFLWELPSDLYILLPASCQTHDVPWDYVLYGVRASLLPDTLCIFQLLKAKNTLECGCCCHVT